MVGENQIFRTWQLAETMDHDAMAWHLLRPIRLQIYSVPEQSGLWRDGLLRLRRQRRRRDSQVQHGSHIAACLSQHHHLAKEQD